MRLIIVTASVGLLSARQEDCLASWYNKANDTPTLIHVQSGMQEDGELQDDPPDFPTYIIRSKQILGVVPAYTLGINKAMELGADLIACFHDDLEILQQDWDKEVQTLFRLNQDAILAGFGGATGLGTEDIYQTPYNPMHLARQNFYSNLIDAESHGMRSTEFIQCACFDGFSQIGRAKFIHDAYTYLLSLGITHHAYDSAIGALAYRDGGEAWLVPIRCQHYGGMTAVGSSQYQEWAKQQNAKGDQGFWEESHRIVYEELREILPIRIGG